MKEAASIVFDLKNLFTLGNSVSWGNSEKQLVEHP